MSLKDVGELVHFRELHFLPRVIFSIGAVLFIGAFFVKEELLGLFGIGVIFFACTFNLLLNVCLQFHVSIKQRVPSFPWILMFQTAIAGVLCWFSLSISVHMFFYNELPQYLPH